ncbi:Sialic acid synthase [Prochlorococcus marinus str. MIT 9215]|uniref:Sialic acid synthase n=1 Tax=Prochlorococcus marinus (strain MIT 9215) TaxID=93060 RepID=A8G663_PROM2|nr:N-acetylneuraminate synthase [Prochlorococcus marinus]ABV51094.1 Sialic acid synthase [Prochlorococcus marinus str. MIT 9215]
MKKKVLVIAEAGVNHNGSLDMAVDLIKEASKAGADIVKFQTFFADDGITQKSIKAKYQIDNENNSLDQYSMLKKLELSPDDHLFLIKKCNENNIEFLSTPFDIKSISLLSKLGLERFKVPSSEVDNTFFLRNIGLLGKEVILSTGMATLGEVEYALDTICDAGTPLNNITVLHCTTQYPTAFPEVNLRAMNTIANSFNVNVGYSDHTLGIEVPIAAVALGAKIIEKHITLDRKLEGPDHKASIEPEEFSRMVKSIRNIEDSLGSNFKKPTQKEIEMRLIMRKSLVASQFINKGELFTQENVTTKRPGNGLPANFLDFVIGRKSSKDYQINDLIDL